MIQLNFNKKEMETLLKIISLGETVYKEAKYSEAEDDEDFSNEANRVAEKFYKTIEKSEFKKLVQRDEDDEFIDLNDALCEEKREIEDIFRENVMYDELQRALGDRDRTENQKDDLENEKEDDMFNNEDFLLKAEEMGKFYKKYRTEFDENGIDNLRIVKNPLFIK